MEFRMGWNTGNSALLSLPITTLFLGLLCLLAFYFVVPNSLKKKIPKGLTLPPGPPRRFVSGNAADMPTTYEWETFTRWAKEYGDLVYAEVFGKPMIFVNSADVAFELFERRSGIYSDRFEFPMANHLMGFNWNFGLMSYGTWWRRHRKAFHKEFNLLATQKYRNIQERQTRSLLRKLAEAPDDFAGHIRHWAGAIIMEVTYGFYVEPGDQYLRTVEKAAEALVEAGVPGRFLVDTIPLLKHVPEWMIGGGFQKHAREVQLINKEIVEAPFRVVQESMRMGKAPPSVLKSLLDELEMRPEAPPDEEQVMCNTAAVAYFTGADTTLTALNIFVLAMLLDPTIQRKAQAELDLVLGADRLPEFEDRRSLPYVNAVCQEVLRWHPVVPLGVAHRVMRDDVYNGYFIPAGSTVIGNSWAMLRDGRKYGPEPEKFNPERFADPGVKYPLTTFGFGRRICPGRHLADDSLFISVASILKMFDITPAIDEEGKKIVVEPLFTSGLLSHPKPFQCSFRLRKSSALALALDQTGTKE